MPSTRRNAPDPNLISDSLQSVVLIHALRDLLSRHESVLQKRAAQVQVRRAEYVSDTDTPEFRIEVSGSRGEVYHVRIGSSGGDPMLEPREDESGVSLLGTTLSAEGAMSGRASRPMLVASCSCPYGMIYHVCKHSAAAASFVLDRCTEVEIEQVPNVIASLQPSQLDSGEQWLDNLEELVASLHEEPAEKREVRYQWRIVWGGPDETPIDVGLAERKPRRGGRGWTKGRLLSDEAISELLPTMGSPRDRLIAGLHIACDYDFSGRTLHTVLHELVAHPNVAWQHAPDRVLNIEEHDVRLRLEPDDEGYRVTAMLDDIDLLEHHVGLRPLYSLGRLQSIVWGDPEGDRLLLARGTAEQLAWIDSLWRAADDGVIHLDEHLTARLMDRLQAVERLTPVDLPPELAGPEMPVPAGVRLVLQPVTPEGMTIRLLVAPPPGLGSHSSSALEMVPGQPPDQVHAVCESGPVVLIRDAQQERNAAAAMARRLHLDGVPTDGPFRWNAATDDEALQLVERVRELGDDAPEVLWPDGGRVRMATPLAPSALRVQIEDRHDWFGINGSVQVDGQEVSLRGLLEAIRLGRQYVRLGHGAFARIGDELRRRLGLLADVTHSDRGSLRTSTAAAPLIEDALGDDINVDADAAWRASLSRLHAARELDPQVPAGLNAHLRDYQVQGYQWLARLAAWGVGGCLADDMGLGKTVQALAVLLDRAADGPALVVAPTSVGANWVREAEQFAPQLNPLVYRDGNRQEMIDNAGPGDLVITSYQLMQRDAGRFASRPWHTLVLDEAQYIKNAATKTAAAARRIEADWRLALSGTPLENHLGELWSLMRVLCPGLLGSWERFKSRYAIPIERDNNLERRQSLSALLQPFILRRTKDQVLKELPARTEIVRLAELSPAERTRYETARMAAVTELTGGAADAAGGAGPAARDGRFQVLAWLTRLRQLACHPRLVDPSWQRGSAKLDLLMDVVEELREGEHRALVFSQFTQHLGLVREALDRRDITYQYLDGSTPAAQRQQRIDAFQAGEGELFLISLKAGGTGLNLTAADYVLHLDPWWNPAVEDQATDRAHRIGQTRPVTVYRLVAKDTIEQQILALHADKRDLVAGILDGSDSATKLSTDEMISLIREAAV